MNKVHTDLQVEDIDRDLVVAFLHHLEQDRNNSIKTRNLRLAAIRGLCADIARREPVLVLTCQRVLAIPVKRTRKRMVDDLAPVESSALLAAPDRSTWIGRRDRCLLAVALQTGLRVSALIGLNLEDVSLAREPDAYVHVSGKGRKERRVPLRRDRLEVLTEWLWERGKTTDTALFLTNRRRRFSRDGMERIVRKDVIMAAKTCPSIGAKRVSPHTLRHSCAMDLLRKEINCTVIALWLGHETIETTPIYRHAEMAIKKRAMDQTTPADVPKGVYQPTDDIRAFLNSL